MTDQQMAELEARRSARVNDTRGDEIGAGELAIGRVLAARTGEPVVFAGRTSLNTTVVELLDGTRWSWDKLGRERFTSEF